MEGNGTTRVPAGEPHPTRWQRGAAAGLPGAAEGRVYANLFDGLRTTVGDVRAMSGSRPQRERQRSTLGRVTASVLIATLGFLVTPSWAATISWTGAGDASSWSDAN